MKKFFTFAIIAVVSALCFISCTKESGDFLFHVETTYPDNMDRLLTAMDKGFQDAGFTRVGNGHYWTLNGEKNATLRKAKETFEARAQYVDKHREEIPFFGSLSALKGYKVTLVYTFGGNEKDITLSTYTFVEEDAK